MILFDRHKIYANLQVIGNVMKGGGPVSRAILEKGVRTVREAEVS